MGSGKEDQTEGATYAKGTVWLEASVAGTVYYINVLGREMRLSLEAVLGRALCAD